MFFLKYLFLRIFRPNALVTLEYSLYRMLNKERKRNGLWPLFYQYDLRKVARKHSYDMADKDYFAHESLDRKSPKDRFELGNVSEVVSGENLAKVRGHSNPVKTSHIGLMNSKGHRENILSKSYNCVGIGCAVSDNKTYYFTQNFSHRVLTVKPLPSKVRIRNTVKVKGRVLDRSIRQVLLMVKDKYDNEIVNEYVDVEYGHIFSFEVHMQKRGEYEFSIFAGLNSLKLRNRFTIQKKGLIW